MQKRRSDLLMDHQAGKRDDKMDKQDALRTALIVTGLFWILLVAAMSSHAEFLGKIRRIIGDEPNGLRFDLYILLFTFQMAVPMIFFVYHAVITLTYAKRYQGTMAHAGDVGAVIGLIGYLRYLLQDRGEGPAIRRSKLITFAGILYLIGIAGWWIYWTDKHGI